MDWNQDFCSMHPLERPAEQVLKIPSLFVGRGCSLRLFLQRTARGYRC